MFTTLLGKRLATLCMYLGPCLLVVFTSTFFPVSAFARTGENPPFPVKVLIITMFPAEQQVWLSHGTWVKESTPIGAIPAQNDGVVYCQKIHGNFNGVCLTKTGVTKVNASASMMAVLRDPDLSFQGAYFLTAGTAATSPATEGTLGFTAWANWIVDRDQGNHLIPKTAPSYKFGYNPPGIFPDGTAVFHLNTELVHTAYDLTRDLILDDSLKAEQERILYPGQASRRPYVAMCDTITSDDIPRGTRLSDETRYITKLLPNLKESGSQGNYCTLEQEDTGTAAVLSRLNYLNCYLNLRAASTFDQPPPEQSIDSFIAEKFRVDDLALGNIYLVGSTLINNYLLQHPSAC